MSLPTISVAMIVKNEAQHIHDIFRTVAGIADELVIVDTGSDDDTLELVREAAAKVSFPVRIFEQRFEPFHYGKAKNWAMTKAEKDYVLVLDADQRLSTEYIRDIKPFLNDSGPAIVEVLQIDDLVPHFLDPQLRLFKTSEGVRYAEDEESRTDERLLYSGKPVRFHGTVQHLQGGRHQLKRKKNWRFQLAIDIEKTERKGGRFRELIRGAVVFYYIFKKIYITRESWKDGWTGFRYAFIRARHRFLVHLYIALKK